MHDAICHRAFFGDADHTFTLTDPMLAELESVTGLGVGALYFQLVNLAYPAEMLREIIRLGLIGGGTSPEAAMRLCDTTPPTAPWPKPSRWPSRLYKRAGWAQARLMTLQRLPSRWRHDRTA